ncbi:MAG: glycosyltransferase family 2 protein [Planctomycetota bacterium]
MQLTVIMPCYNEAPTLAESVARVLAAELPEGVVRDVVIVDDASTDESRSIAERLANENDAVSFVTHPRNRGKGAAVRTGIEHASGDMVLIHDADLEYDPADHAAAIEPILDGKADAVIGTRFLGSRPHRVLYFWHYAANRFLTMLCDMVSNLNLTDMECCTKVMTREVALAVQPNLREDRFGIEPELVIQLSRARLSGNTPLRIYEVPVAYAGRTYADGKKIGWRDGIEALQVIARLALTR